MTLRSFVPLPLKRLYRKGKAFRDLLIHPNGVLCSVDGIMIRIGVSSPTESFRVKTYATKEPETLAWIQTNLKAGDVFFDIGANIGLYSIYAAKFEPGCRVYAFEPAAKNFDRLCRNISLNRLPNTIPCNFPIADGIAFELFFVGDFEAGSSSHALGGPSLFVEDGVPIASRQGALAVSLDVLVRDFQLPCPALLKIDVDVSEALILDGAAEVLASPILRTVLLEWNSRTPEDVSGLTRRMQGHGLTLEARSAWTETVRAIEGQNFIFRKVGS